MSTWEGPHAREESSHSVELWWSPPPGPAAGSAGHDEHYIVYACLASVCSANDTALEHWQTLLTTSQRAHVIVQVPHAGELTWYRVGYRVGDLFIMSRASKFATTPITDGSVA